MNYPELINRGYRYIISAGDNWDRRHWKLISLWGKTPNPIRKNRVVALIDELETRIKVIGRYLHEFKEWQTRARIDAEQHMLKLECPTIDCRYKPTTVGEGIPFKNYEPGKIKCKTCGVALVMKGENELEIFLSSLGIHIEN